MNTNNERYHHYARAVKRFFRRNGAICAAGACALMVGVVFALSTLRNSQPEPATQTAPAAPSQILATQQAMQQPGTTAPATVAPATTEASQAADQGRQMIWPVKGEVQMEFAKDKLIFQPTLGQWAVHPALDIQAQPGIDVVAAMQGRVEAVREDKMLGKTVVVLHEDGWKSYYCSLKTIDVTVGDTLKAGEKLGTVGQSALEEVNQGSHLHFVLERNGEPVNPLDYLPAQ
jgi:murein DD-endopeptidase MepM/ murein hydrolase activator NlpD